MAGFDHIHEKRKWLQDAKGFSAHLTSNAIKAKRANTLPPMPKAPDEPHPGKDEAMETAADEAAESPAEQAAELAMGGEAHGDAGSCPHCGMPMAKKDLHEKNANPAAHSAEVLHRLRSSM